MKLDSGQTDAALVLAGFTGSLLPSQSQTASFSEDIHGRIAKWYLDFVVGFDKLFADREEPVQNTPTSYDPPKVVPYMKE